MFEATLGDISLLRESLGTIAELIDETELHIKMDGMKIIASDRAVVVVVDYMLNRDAFDDYKYEKDERIGLNLASLLQVIRRAKTEDKLKFSLKESTIHIILDGGYGSKRSFTLPIIDVSKEETPPLDTLSFPASLRISSDVFSSGVEDAELIADSIVLTARKGLFSMKAEKDASNAHLELEPSNSLKINDIGEPVRSRYSVDYMKKITKAKKLSDFMDIYMANDYPLKIVYTVPGKMHLGFVLAPRVED